MDIAFECDKCGQPLVVDESGAGMRIQCPNPFVSPYERL